MFKIAKTVIEMSGIDAERLALALVEKIASTPSSEYSQRVEMMYLMTGILELPGEPVAIKDGEEIYQYAIYPEQAKMLKKLAKTL